MNYNHMLNRTEVIIYIEPEDNSTEDSPNNDDNIINDTINNIYDDVLVSEKSILSSKGVNMAKTGNPILVLIILLFSMPFIIRRK
ncbi:hypothetical protein MBBWO_00130 [Methanobrevibacter woesei]|uniref:Uncharacterized protein n=1 Tax=Methanobrevibacter woesei TaxID=190976 RepID=A0A2U1S9K9_9EURY|nr:hypothetical protein [Methanobrevibacter woesei]MCI7291371.1 hypothetical protein [Methanobrevibacter woesei]PWB87235.1 hypothetical protein MBBWO_00130 [Methanobrevibacter woesei]